MIRRTLSISHSLGVFSMRTSLVSRALCVALALPLLAACSDDKDTDTMTSPNVVRTFNQIERLGNPLVSEVFFMKRDHGLHNSTAPATDSVNGFRTKIKAFTDAFGRGNTIGNTLAAVLVPDMLLVFPNRAGTTAGWLSWALANGYGGRRLNDDVVDAGLTAIFGNLLDPAATVLPGLTSDNVSTSGRTYLTTFPYLEAAR
jgi:Domain of unknown function (DUF4331)